MALLIPVKYHDRNYPKGIQANIEEVSGHLDVTSVKRVNKYSLHTEYSSPQRNLNSTLLQRFHTLRAANINGVPQLWFNSQWAEEFAGFIEAIVGENCPPLVIEIHPPYKDYCTSIEQFCEIYRVFEDRILSVYPDTGILIENRFGNKHKTGKFLVSSGQDILELVSYLEKGRLHLGIILDIPQLISQIGDLPLLSVDRLRNMFTALSFCRGRIKSIHLWGISRFRNGRMRFHFGDLDNLFERNKTIKQAFLEGLYELFNDDIVRYFVPEVESTDEDLASIVSDLISVGFSFQEPPHS